MLKERNSIRGFYENRSSLEELVNWWEKVIRLSNTYKSKGTLENKRRSGRPSKLNKR